jgi:hypothetical protein
MNLRPLLSAILLIGACRIACAEAADVPAAPTAPSPEELRKAAAALEKAKKDVQRQLDQAAQNLVPVVHDDLVAWTDLRTVDEGSGDADETARLQKLCLQALLGRGMLVFPFEQDHAVTVAYKNGKLPKGLYLGVDDGRWLAGRGVRYLLVPRLEVKDARHVLQIDAFDLAKGQALGSFRIAATLAKEQTIAELLDWSELPERNVRILAFAAAHLGQQVDRGECWDLPAHVINGDGGHVDSYSFGKEVPWEEGRPGDVITIGTSGATGGHVMVLLRWAKDRSQAVILHQNANGVRAVALGVLGPVEAGKPGQKLALWRP